MRDPYLELLSFIKDPRKMRINTYRGEPSENWGASRYWIYKGEKKRLRFHRIKKIWVDKLGKEYAEEQLNEL